MLRRVDTTAFRGEMPCTPWPGCVSAGKKDKAKKAQKEKDPGKKKPDDEEDPGFKMQPSVFLGDLLNSCGLYQDVWSEKDERDNPSQNFYRDMIQQDKEREVRPS